MTKFIKRIFLSIIVLFFVAITALVIFIYTFDPNSYKSLINDQLTNATNHNVKIDGEIKLKMFPNVNFEINNILVSKDLKKEPIAKIDKINLSVKFVPLLQKEVKVNKIYAKNLVLKLITNKDGRKNWNDFKSKTSKETISNSSKNDVSASDDEFDITDVTISGIDLDNADITWHDQSKNQFFRLSGLYLSASSIGHNRTSPFDFSANIHSNDNSELVNLKLNGKLKADFIKNNFSLTPLQATIQGKDQKSKKTLEPVTITAPTTIEMLTPQGLHVKSNVSFAKTQLNGILKAFMSSDYPFSDRALSNVSGNANLELLDNNLSIDDLNLTSDNLTIKSNAKINLADKPHVQFDLFIDKLNLDRLLAKDSKASTQKSKSSSKKGTASSSSSSFLNTFDADGKIKINSLFLNKMKIYNITSNLNNKNAILKIQNLKASLYEGHLNGDISINGKTSTPVTTLSQSLNNINVSLLLQDLINDKPVTGTGNISNNLTFRGFSKNSILSSLNGKSNVTVTNGTFGKFSIVDQIQVIDGFLNKQFVPKKSSSNNTSFDSFAGTFMLNNGIARSDNIKLTAPEFLVTAKGTYNLINSHIDYVLRTQFSETTNAGNILTLQDQIGGAIILYLTGTIDNPSIKPDLVEIGKAIAKQKLSTEIEKIIPTGDDSPQKEIIKDVIKGFLN